MTAGLEHAAVLVLRAWFENPGVLRVRIISSPVWGQGEEEVSAAASVDDAVAIVRRWLEELSAAE